MNICFLTQEYPPDTGWGGIGTYTYNLAHALGELGHSVHVVTTALPPRQSFEQSEGNVHVHRIARKSVSIPLLRRIWFRLSPRTKHQWENIFSITPAIRRIVATSSIDIIEAPELWSEGLGYSMRRRVPIVVKLHSPIFLILHGNGWKRSLDWRLVEAADRAWTRRADGLTSASASLADSVSRVYGISRSRVRVIPVPVDTARFHPPPPSSLPTKKVLFVGRLEPRKGVFALVEAIPRVLATHPDARFLLVGKDTLENGKSVREKLTTQLRQAGALDRVDFRGHVQHSEMPALFQECAVYVCPSRWENCPTTCLEAMASGKPVIASRVGGIPEIVDEGQTGMLVPVDDGEALAQAVNQVLANPGLARDWGERARRAAETRYDTWVIAREVLAHYQQTILEWQQRTAS